MKLSILYSISRSLMVARWKQTLVAAIGVTFSITMFIALLGFMEGLNDLLDGLILNRTPHVRLYKEIEPSEQQPIEFSADHSDQYNFVQSVKPKKDNIRISNSGTVINFLENDPSVLGVAPKVNAQVFYNLGSVSLTGVINGIDVEEENRLFSFSDYVVAGRYIDLKNVPNSVILGKGIAEKMMVDLGDNVQVTAPSGEIYKLKVVGLFQSGLAEIDKVQSYCSLSTTQNILGESEDFLTDIQIKLKNIEDAPQKAIYYANLFELNAVDVFAVNAQFETGSSIRSLISYAVGITLLIVAGFGIYNILNMMIYDKMDAIAILKATGFSGKDVSRIFTMIALTIGTIGGMVGLLLGFLVCLMLGEIPFDTQALPTIETYPINYAPQTYIIGSVFSIVTTYFAGFFPSRKASRVDPVEIIRGK